MVYELNGIARDKFDLSAPETRGDPRWDGFARPPQPQQAPAPQTAPRSGAAGAAGGRP